MPIDPITADVIGYRFQAATDEMLATLVKTAFSPNVKEISFTRCTARSPTLLGRRI
jgi:N-methylhydantoinase B/oxoprolinase/acetone carboxylase alpha subunit